MITIAMAAPVECVDGYVGDATQVVVDPATRRVTHLVVLETGLDGIERVAPVDLIAHATPELVRLGCTQATFTALPPFSEKAYVRGEYPSSPCGRRCLHALHPHRGYVDPGADGACPARRAGCAPGDAGAGKRWAGGPAGRTGGRPGERRDHPSRAGHGPCPGPEGGDAAGLSRRPGRRRHDPPQARPRSGHGGAGDPHHPALPLAGQDLLNVEIVVFIFDDIATGHEALHRLLGSQYTGNVEYVDAAVVVKAADGRAVADELTDMEAGQGAFLGAIVGALAALAGGPAGFLAAAGAAVGGAVSKLVDVDFGREPGSAATGDATGHIGAGGDGRAPLARRGRAGAGRAAASGRAPGVTRSGRRAPVGRGVGAARGQQFSRLTL